MIRYDSRGKLVIFKCQEGIFYVKDEAKSTVQLPGQEFSKDTISADAAQYVAVRQVVQLLPSLTFNRKVLDLRPGFYRRVLFLTRQ